MQRTVKGDANKILSSSLAASFFSLGRSRDRNRGLLVARQFKESDAPRPGRVAVRASGRLLVPVRPGPAGRSLVAIRPCVRRHHRAGYSYFSKGAPTHTCVLLLLIDRPGRTWVGRVVRRPTRHAHGEVQMCNALL